MSVVPEPHRLANDVAQSQRREFYLGRFFLSLEASTRLRLNSCSNSC